MPRLSTVLPIRTGTACYLSSASGIATQKMWCGPPGKKYEWAPVGAGVVDWVGQFRAFAKDGYHYAVSLETHWRGAGTPEASTRVSMKGLKETLSKAGLNC